MSKVLDQRQAYLDAVRKANKAQAKLKKVEISPRRVQTSAQNLINPLQKGTPYDIIRA